MATWKLERVDRYGGGEGGERVPCNEVQVGTFWRCPGNPSAAKLEVVAPETRDQVKAAVDEILREEERQWQAHLEKTARLHEEQRKRKLAAAREALRQATKEPSTDV